MDKRSTQLEILVKNTEAMLNVGFQGEFFTVLQLEYCRQCANEGFHSASCSRLLYDFCSIQVAVYLQIPV